MREADVVVGFGIATLQNVDESLGFEHPKAKATSVPNAQNPERAGTVNTDQTVAVSAI